MISGVGGSVVVASGVTSAVNLPPGVVFPGIYGADSISGTPTTKGIFQSTINGLGVTWQISDTGPSWGWLPDPFTVNNLTVGVPSALQLVPTGGPPTGSVTFGLMAAIFPYCAIPGSLPPGISLASDGHVTGTPTVAGSYAASIYGLDSNFNGSTGQNNLQIVVASGSGGSPLTAACGSPPGGNVGDPYTHAFIASGGNPPYTWTAISGVPAGLSLSAGGTLSGTPTVAGSYTVEVSVSTAGWGPVVLDCSIVIAPAVAPAGSATPIIPVQGLPVIPLPRPAVCF